MEAGIGVLVSICIMYDLLFPLGPKKVGLFLYDWTYSVWVVET